MNSSERELFLVVNVSSNQSDELRGRVMLTTLDMQPGAMADRSEPPPPLQYKMEGLDEALGVSSRPRCDWSMSISRCSSIVAMDRYLTESAYHGQSRA